jgi:hypothetical protein
MSRATARIRGRRNIAMLRRLALNLAKLEGFNERQFKRAGWNGLGIDASGSSVNVKRLSACLDNVSA